MKKKTLAYIIGGEARLVAETFRQDEIYQQLCEKYKVHTYIHSWTQLGRWTKANEKYRFGTRPETSKFYPPDFEIVKNYREVIMESIAYTILDLLKLKIMIHLSMLKTFLVDNI